MSTDSPHELAVEVSAARLAVISRLADDLAHEIKNPLNAVVINLAVLRTRVGKGDVDGALERAEVVETEVLRAHDLIDRVLRLARPARDEPMEEPVERVLADVVPLAALQARLARVALHADAVPEGLLVLARPASLRAALLALLGDAVGGCEGTEADPGVAFRCIVEGHEVRFVVRVPGTLPPGDGTVAVLADAAGGGLEEMEVMPDGGHARALVLPRAPA